MGRPRSTFWFASLLILSVMVSSCAGSPATATPAPKQAPVPTSTPSAVTSSPRTTATLIPLPAPTLTMPLTPSADARAIMARASQGIAVTTSYRMDRYIAAAKTIRSAGKSDEFDLETWTTLALNTSGRQLQMDNSVKVKPPAGQPAWPLIQNSMYIVDGTIYIQGLFPDEPQLWGKKSASEDYWQMQNQAKQLVELLQASNVSVLAPESVRSGNLVIPCDVLQATPNLEKFWVLLLQQPGIQTLQLPSQPPPAVNFSQMIKSAKMKLWVAQTSGVPVQAELSMKLQIGPALVATLTSDVSMDLGINMLFHDYDQSVAIELPQEAKDAAEISLQSAP